ncbi:MAG: transporter [Hyphomicrobium sp.]|nr:transporter [Hyphomicrobium sp.]
MTHRTLTRASALLALVTGSTLSPALAHDGQGPRPDGHAPAGVMVDHMHKAGEFMVGYRYQWSQFSGDTLRGTSSVDDHEIMHNGCGSHECSAKQSEMLMQMHMLDIMYAPTDWLTLMVMPMWMSMDMTMVPLEGAGHHGGGHGDDHGGHDGPHAHGTDGFSDVVFGALVALTDTPGAKLHTGLMVSAPTGSVSEKGSNGNFTHYMMQLGSGTWDFQPSLTYNGRMDRVSWGAQVSGIIRMEDDNDSGYRLGDVFQATAWSAYRLTDWLSASVRVIHTQQGQIEGHYNAGHNHSSPPDLQYNYGGNFWDVGFGVNTVVPSGLLQGHRLSVEWLEPIKEDVNGYQQERDGTL